MKVLSLFDGMCCGMLAMQAAGVEVDRYVAYEIDKYAIKVASHNFPQIEQCGDVFKADFTQYQGFDYQIGGSPCTYWSIAQKNNRETEASGIGWELFSQYVRALREAKPKYFIYENNKSMSKQIRASIDETFGFEAVGINSSLVSAQNRQRLYWVGKREPDGTYSKVDVQQPDDRGILLQDVLDGAVAWQEKSYCITATEYKGSNPGQTLNKHRRTMVGEEQNPVCMRYERTDEAKRVRKAYEAGEVHHGFHELSEMHPRTDGKTNTLSTVLKDNPICEPVAVPIDESGIEHLGSLYGQHSRWGVFGADGKAPTVTASMGMGGGHIPMFPQPTDEPGNCTKNPTDKKQIYEVRNGLITIKGKQYPIKLADGYYIIRKLTVAECKRLQTVPEWYGFSVISNSQAYKCLGNGWTVEVIAHLIKATARYEEVKRIKTGERRNDDA